MMNNFAVNAPLGSVSFGQVTYCILREMKSRGLNPSIFPIGGNVDISAQKPDQEFNQWLETNIKKAASAHKRTDPCFKLWHLSDLIQSYSEKQVALSFYECDSPTTEEINAVRNNSKVFY
jgi:hypothetical protein